MNNQCFIQKIKGNADQIKLLFELLKSREHNISHSVLPSYKDHEEFVLNNPYKVWYLVFKNRKPVGTFYIKYDNSIGLNILIQDINLIEFIINYIRDKYSPEPSIPSVIPPYFYFNISENNLELKIILQKLNLNPFQISYKL